MVTKYQPIQVDDIDGQSPAETVEFEFDGEKFVIDLSKKHRSDLRRSLKRYMEAARKTAVTPSGATTAVTTLSDRQAENKTIREWARSHKIDVPARGRIPRAVVEQYNTYQENLVHVG